MHVLIYFHLLNIIHWLTWHNTYKKSIQAFQNYLLETVCFLNFFNKVTFLKWIINLLMLLTQHNILWLLGNYGFIWNWMYFLLFTVLYLQQIRVRNKINHDTIYEVFIYLFLFPESMYTNMKWLISSCFFFRRQTLNNKTNVMIIFKRNKKTNVHEIECVNTQTITSHICVIM